ncbi:hypothetical protein AN639_05960 [Candidatus Epulonipiscium fishelsonii]|uniref:Uncharacterized protein n=1 Tax=Candidatus Epulonipiscium fishelsonii TaxID=77094 RepID=A0ACC8XC34_9FIRM|nr:hypothetical protein AN639_05960 [Epulopiscium sp. SCG-B05WGA-EpuloA1]ONI40044.1 hypothetical protein AN396_06760 [Epulopiscium sp. SCG-B11WGA-EpuloA1]
MELKSCKRCKALFQYYSGKVMCTNCKQADDDYFLIVKEFLRDNPSASAEMINSETDVPVKIIKEFIKEGRLEISDKSPLAVDCERCGKKSTTGRICPACKSEIAMELNSTNKNLKSSQKQLKPAEHKGMRSKH